MNILAIDASGDTTSVSIVCADDNSADSSEPGAMRSSALLLPMITSCLRRTGRSMLDIQRISVSRGPGSFTGVRVALATARGISLGTGIEIWSPGTLDALFFRSTAQGVVVTLLNARRGQAYFQIDRRHGTTHESLLPASVCAWSDLLARIEAVTSESPTFVGVPTDPPLPEPLLSRFGAVVTSDHPLSRAVALLASREERCVHGDLIEPLYVRDIDAKLPTNAAPLRTV